MYIESGNALADPIASLLKILVTNGKIQTDLLQKQTKWSKEQSKILLHDPKHASSLQGASYPYKQVHIVSVPSKRLQILKSGEEYDKESSAIIALSPKR